ncbi:uncharacterized protein LOC130187678 isoform X2 [Seriola aureovittata]|uniref:uncharacterized protein LOC130187678 isoform X2 n=1 Tax=Seriola aureovittata TaxID=2871759 RepID=UPI0024BDA1D5|nr:uncharacterized protein LOC130187678 isoform X2 [Seriola aureovittata]
MVELKWTKWIKMSLFVMLGLQFTAVTGQDSVFVRVGDEAALPCKNVRHDQDKCDATTWTFSSTSASVELVVLGKIGENAKSKSARLSLTENCSLVLKNVTREDAGRYGCRQFDKSRQQQGSDSVVDLSVVTMTEHEDGDMVVLFCSVSAYKSCGYPQWLYEGIKDDAINIVSTPDSCSARVSFNTFHLRHKSKYQESFKCEVTDGNRKKRLLFTFIPQSSGKKTGRWWRYVIVAVGLAALLIIAVVLIRWKRTKGNKRRRDDKTGPSLNPAVSQSAPETGQDTADPEEGVSYASISYTKRTDGRAQVHLKDDDDDDDAVTYSTVKTPSSSAGAAADPRDVYATVDKPNKSEVTV